MKSNLIKRGFVSLLLAQFLGAANDNILKQVLIFMVGTGVWAGALGRGGEGSIALCLTIPFILLSGFAGQFADRYSKRRIIWMVKIAEIPIAGIALIGLWTRSLALTMVAFVLLAVQSTFFGPAKYGVIPELVDDQDLSRANGALNMLTNIAIIFGTLAAGPVCDAYWPQVSQPAGSSPVDPAGPAPGILWLPGVVLVCVAGLGLLAALIMQPLRPQAPHLAYRWNPVKPYLEALAEMKRGPLLLVAMAWGYFYMIGMIAILILPNYTAVLQIDYTQTSRLIGVLGVAIGVGSVTAGLISGHRIEPRLIPIGAVGMTIFFFLLGSLTPTYWNVAALLLGAGIFAGFYIVPLQAMLQHLSPNDERGRFLGTANALSFCFSATGSIIYWVAMDVAQFEANRVFMICAVLAVLGTGYLLWRLRRLIAEREAASA